ncbi:MAG TPA: hypothetical protein VF746_18580 [Longimicrobium sp.]|jgi:hypothetical protein
MSANLLSADYRRRTLVYLALGGSGARALEPLLHLCALGLGPAQLRVLLVDPDQGNAAITRVGRVLDQYRAARERLADAGAASSFFRTEVVDVLPESRVWSPIADDGYMPDTRFAAGVDRQVMDADAPELGVLFDLLNSRRVREMDLAMGFRGVPSVGTVFMNRLRDEAFFAQLLSQYHGAAGATVFFAAGSVFGGTGAAALPVVGRALRDGVQPRPGASAIRGAARARLGAALLLPYFTLPTPGGAPADGGPRPENALFAHNAAGALPTYLDRERDPGYGAYYLVGDSLPREQARNELGGDAQANAAHYVELFAALAALDFTARGGEEREDRLPIYRATGVGSDEPGWGDLPVDRGTRRALKGALVALHTFLSFFRPNGGSPEDLAAALHGVTWAGLLRLPPTTWSDRSDALDAVGQSWMSTWEWLRELRRSTPALRLAAATTDQPTRVPTHALIEGFGRGGQRGRRPDDVFSVFRAWNTEAARRRNGGFGAFVEVLRAGSERFAEDRFPEAEQPGQEED